MPSKSMVNDRHVSLRLPLELATALNVIAEYAHASRSQILRAAADEYVSKFLPEEG